MSNDYSTTEVQATQYPTDWEPHPFYFGKGGVLRYAATGGRGSRSLSESPLTSRGCADGPTAVHSDQGTIRARLELVLARLLEGKRQLADLNNSLRLCQEGIAQLLSAGSSEHLSFIESELLGIRARADELDIGASQEVQPGRAHRTLELTPDRATTGFHYTGTYNPRSGGGDT